MATENPFFSSTFPVYCFILAKFMYFLVLVPSSTRPHMFICLQFYMGCSDGSKLCFKHYDPTRQWDFSFTLVNTCVCLLNTT